MSFETFIFSGGWPIPTPYLAWILNIFIPIPLELFTHHASNKGVGLRASQEVRRWSLENSITINFRLIQLTQLVINSFSICLYIDKKNHVCLNHLGESFSYFDFLKTSDSLKLTRDWYLVPKHENLQHFSTDFKLSTLTQTSKVPNYKTIHWPS